MKKIFSTLAIAIMALSMQSCLHDDTELFDQSAAERIQSAVNDTKTLLQSASNGWMLTYYTGEEYSGGGYNMFMKFNDATVDISADYAQPDYVCNSSWTVKKDQGVVISFDTYNEILHYLGNPSKGAIDGQQADYEFVVMEQSNDQIKLKGKKWKNIMTLTRLEDSFSWSEYISGVQETVALLNKRYLTADGTLITIDVSGRRLYQTGDNIGIMFTATPEGISFLEDYTIEGKTLSYFTVDRETGELTSDLTGNIPLYIPPLSEIIQTNYWFFSAEGLSDAVMPYFQKAVEGSAAEGEAIGFMTLGVIPWNESTVGFGFQSGDYRGYWGFAFDIIDDNTVTITMQTYDGNGKYYYQKAGYDGIATILTNFVSGKTWSLSTDNIKSPSYILMTNPDKPEETIKLSAAEVYYPFGE